MKQQLQKMQEAIDYIRTASDDELHEILVSLGARSTKPQATSAKYHVVVSRSTLDKGLFQFVADASGSGTDVKGPESIQVRQLVVARNEMTSTTTAFRQPSRSGGLVA